MFGEWQRAFHIEGNVALRKIPPERKLHRYARHNASKTVIGGMIEPVECVWQGMERVGNPAFGEVMCVGKMQNVGDGNHSKIYFGGNVFPLTRFSIGRNKGCGKASHANQPISSASSSAAMKGSPMGFPSSQIVM